jgi:glucuronoarabinoxylan endo-1,4-beta-xylanase
MPRTLSTISLLLGTAAFAKHVKMTLTAIFFVSLAGYGCASAQTATINWTNVHQEIDGFGAADAGNSSSMSSANQAFFFGLGTGQLGLSLLRAGVSDGSLEPGSCASVGSSCAGVYVSDMQAMIANGGRVYASPWSPPAAYKTNRNITCNRNAGLKTADYAAYATWLANYVESLAEYGITLYAISVQNEPDVCTDYDSASWTSAEFEKFVTNNLGPTFAADGLSTLVFLPEVSDYPDLVSYGKGCLTSSSCSKYVAGVNWHDYDASLRGTNTITANPYPSGWPAGKKYWETEASCGPGFGPNFCQSGFNTDITDALDWAAVIDQRIAVDGANAWLYWWLINYDNTDDQGLMASNGTVAQRAYMMGQYSKFVRPGYYRIDATHLPNPNVSVSAYQNTGTNTLVVIATNYSSSAVSQTFTLTNAPAFSTLTPTITSASLSLAEQTSISVSSNSFTYTLPAQSITTFVGSAQ